MTPLPPPTASRDAITGLPGPGTFTERLNAALLKRREGDRGIALLQVELGASARVRATQGHVAGDLMLRHAAMRLLEVTRADDVACRLGPASFGVALLGVRHPREAAGVCVRLSHGLAEAFDLPGGPAAAEPRIGVTFTTTCGQDAATLASQAEGALARARAREPGSFAFFDPALDAELQQFRTLERDLGAALEQGQFKLQFQPQIEVASRRVVGAEALLRWDHPEFGLIPPDAFIPMAEDRGEIVKIGAWVLEEACKLGSAFAASTPFPFGISVNLSPMQLRAPGFAASVAEILARTGFPAPHLTLEITEHMLVRDTEESFRVLAELARLGVKLSMDDFGLGFSSLAYLLHFAFDEIKVDRCFIAGAARDRTSAAIVRATLGLARDLGMLSVAEGVETEAQYALLAELGCTVAQGYLFSAAVDAAELATILSAAAEADQANELDLRRA